MSQYCEEDDKVSFEGILEDSRDIIESVPVAKRVAIVLLAEKVCNTIYTIGEHLGFEYDDYMAVLDLVDNGLYVDDANKSGKLVK